MKRRKMRWRRINSGHYQFEEVDGDAAWGQVRRTLDRLFVGLGDGLYFRRLKDAKEHVESVYRRMARKARHGNG